MPSKNEESNLSGEVLKINAIIHQKNRLGIMTTLAAHPNGILFTDLKQLTDLTDGNMNRHLKVLDEAGFLEVNKSNSGRNSKSVYRLSKIGFQQFVQYIENLDAVLRQAQNAAEQNATDFKRNDLPGFGTA